MAPFYFRHYDKCFKLHSTNEKKMSGRKNMQKRFWTRKAEMEEISEERKNIREGQRQVREKFEAIETEYEELKRAKSLKAEMRKVHDDQNCIRKENRKIRLKNEEIERQCHQLKEETEIIMKQTENVLLKFKILKARQLRDLLRELVAKESVIASLAEPEIKKEKSIENSPTPRES